MTDGRFASLFLRRTSLPAPWLVACIHLVAVCCCHSPDHHHRSCRRDRSSNIRIRTWNYYRTEGGGWHDCFPCRGNPPGQPVQQLSQELIATLAAIAQNDNERKRTIVISDATTQKSHELLDFLSVPETGASWPNKPETFGDFPGFAWREERNDDSVENRTAYMAHLKQHVQLPVNYLMGDVQPMRTLLTTDIQGVGDWRRISGTTDVIITESKNINNTAIRNNVEALLELNKPKNSQKKDHSPQTICEHVAASFLNHKHGVVSALTYLNGYWTFFWYAGKPVWLSGSPQARTKTKG
jgi:hypothetical protein